MQYIREYNGAYIPRHIHVREFLPAGGTRNVLLLRHSFPDCDKESTTNVAVIQSRTRGGRGLGDSEKPLSALHVERVHDGRSL